MKPRFLLAACLASLALAALPAWAQPPLAVPVDGQAFPAELAAADADWQLSFSSGEKRRTMPAAELVRWGSCAFPSVGDGNPLPNGRAGGPILVLADGGLLVADVLRSEKDRLQVDSGLFGLVDVPLGRLAGVLFDLPAGRTRRDLLLDRIARPTGQSDRLLLANGDELTGLIESIRDDTVRLATDDGPLEIETARIAGLVFNPLLKPPPADQGLRAWVGLADGSRLLATRMLMDRSSLQITTAGGQTWKTSSKELVFLQPLGGRVTYLSDLKAADYVQVPYLSLPWPTYGIDRNVTGGRLRCDGRLYLKGLGVHGAAQLTYRLDGPFKRFQAEVGIDDSTSGGGSVRLRVRADGRQKQTVETVVRGRMAPVPVSVDLDGATRLDLIVDYADRADVLDHADWLDARLVR